MLCREVARIGQSHKLRLCHRIDAEVQTLVYRIYDQFLIEVPAGAAHLPTAKSYARYINPRLSKWSVVHWD